jgi:hypothetical protein
MLSTITSPFKENEMSSDQKMAAAFNASPEAKCVLEALAKNLFRVWNTETIPMVSERISPVLAVLKEGDEYRIIAASTGEIQIRPLRMLSNGQVVKKLYPIAESVPGLIGEMTLVNRLNSWNWEAQCNPGATPHRFVAIVYMADSGPQWTSI